VSVDTDRVVDIRRRRPGTSTRCCSPSWQPIASRAV